MEILFGYGIVKSDGYPLGESLCAEGVSDKGASYVGLDEN